MSKHNLLPVYVVIKGQPGHTYDDLINNAREAVARRKLSSQVGDFYEMSSPDPLTLCGNLMVDQETGNAMKLWLEGFGLEWNGVIVTPSNPY